MTAAAPVPRVRRAPWWREVLYVLAFYAVYSLVRNTQGSAAVSADVAFRNALEVIRLERVLGLFHEERLQELFLPAEWFVALCGVFYGTAHFVVTVLALVLLFRRAPARYVFWRNVLACTTALALVGYALYPLMPPRLLPQAFGFVDTLRVVGGLWSFDSDAVEAVSNQYAAMPSLHFAWAVWAAAVLLPMAARGAARVLVAAHPVVTLFTIVVTGNHYVLDAVAGAVVLGAGFLLARAMTGRAAPNPVDGVVQAPA